MLAIRTLLYLYVKFLIGKAILSNLLICIEQDTTILAGKSSLKTSILRPLIYPQPYVTKGTCLYLHYFIFLTSVERLCPSSMY